jgi:hypothetical protein
MHITSCTSLHTSPCMHIMCRQHCTHRACGHRLNCACASQDHQLPELQRCPLDELCLVVRQMDPACSQSIEEFLSKAPDPPVAQATAAAITLLQVGRCTRQCVDHAVASSVCCSGCLWVSPTPPDPSATSSQLL